MTPAQMMNATGQTGLVIVPCGPDAWLVGEAMACSISCHQDSFRVDDQSDWVSHAVGFITTDISLTCLGQPTIVDRRPMLLDDASVLELLRQVRRKQKERDG